MEAYFLERFGVPPEVLARFSWVRRGHTTYALSADHGDKEPTRGLQVVSAGLPFARKVGKYLKPTSAALRLLEAWITRNRVELAPAQALELIRQGQISLDHGLSEGYVLVESSGLALGCALALRGRIKSQIPRREAGPGSCIPSFSACPKDIPHCPPTLKNEAHGPALEFSRQWQDSPEGWEQS